MSALDTLAGVCFAMTALGVTLAVPVFLFGSEREVVAFSASVALVGAVGFLLLLVRSCL